MTNNFANEFSKAYYLFSFTSLHRARSLAETCIIVPGRYPIGSEASIALLSTLAHAVYLAC